MAEQLTVYGRRVNCLVVQIAEEFTSKDCEKLRFIYEDSFPAPFRERYGENALQLLKKLREQKVPVFSNDKLEKLANLMVELGLPLLRDRVDAFIG